MGEQIAEDSLEKRAEISRKKRRLKADKTLLLSDEALNNIKVSSECTGLKSTNVTDDSSSKASPEEEPGENENGF